MNTNDRIFVYYAEILVQYQFLTVIRAETKEQTKRSWATEPPLRPAGVGPALTRRSYL